MNDFMKSMLGDLEKEAAEQPGQSTDYASTRKTKVDGRPMLGSVTGGPVKPSKMPLLPGQKPPRYGGIPKLQTGGALSKAAPAAAPARATVRDIKPNLYQQALRKHKKGSAERKALVAQRKAGKKVSEFGGSGSAAAKSPGRRGSITMGKATGVGASGPSKPGKKIDFTPASKLQEKEPSRLARGIQRVGAAVKAEQKKRDTSKAISGKSLASVKSKPREKPLQTYKNTGKFRADKPAYAGMEGKGPLVGPKPSVTPRTSGPGTDAYATRQRELNKQRASTRRAAELRSKKSPAMVAKR